MCSWKKSASTRSRPYYTDRCGSMQILSAIQAHFGENVVRARFSDYAQRFVRLASRHEEVVNGTSSIGPKSRPWSSEGLGSGIVFSDDSIGKREIATNAQRLEGWSQTGSYKRYKQVRGRWCSQLYGLLTRCNGAAIRGRFALMPRFRCAASVG